MSEKNFDPSALEQEFRRESGGPFIRLMVFYFLTCSIIITSILVFPEAQIVLSETLHKTLDKPISRVIFSRFFDLYDAGGYSSTSYVVSLFAALLCAPFGILAYFRRRIIFLRDNFNLFRDGKFSESPPEKVKASTFSLIGVAIVFFINFGISTSERLGMAYLLVYPFNIFSGSGGLIFLMIPFAYWADDIIGPNIKED